jgi:hypothetical protein
VESYPPPNKGCGMCARMRTAMHFHTIARWYIAVHSPPAWASLLDSMLKIWS